MNGTRKKCVFGPIRSRRLGFSLGVDLLPFKTCSMDCIYCECGATTCLTMERKEYFPADLALKQIDEALTSGTKIDYVTFSGVGEPTLDTGIGSVIRHVHSRFPGVKVCMLTNSTTLLCPGVIDDLAECDLVIPSLDGSTEEELARLNRSEKTVTLAGIMEGLIRLRKRMKGKMHLEIFLAAGLNDSRESAIRFRDLVAQIRPHLVQLNTLDRPGTEKSVEIPAPETLAMIASIIGEVAPVECIGGRASAQKQAGVQDVDSYNGRILKQLEKGSFSASEIASASGLNEQQLPAHLRRMEKAGLIEEINNTGKFRKL